MYEVNGFVFHEKDDKIERIPLLKGLLANNYEEVHEVMKEMQISHYMFVLKEVKV